MSNRLINLLFLIGSMSGVVNVFRETNSLVMAVFHALVALVCGYYFIKDLECK